MTKSENAYKTIGEVVKILNLKNNKGKSSPTHTIRFWEKKFTQIKPRIMNGNRRYYDLKNIEQLKKIKFLLKDQGLTISGAKKVLDNNNVNDLDEIVNTTIKTNNLKIKLLRISNIIKELKK